MYFLSPKQQESILEIPPLIWSSAGQIWAKSAEPAETVSSLIMQPFTVCHMFAIPSASFLDTILSAPDKKG